MKLNTIFMRFPGGLPKAVTLSYDDGVDEDIRLIEIMKQYGVKGTFNINSGLEIEEGYEYPPEKKVGKRMTAARTVEVYSQDGIEVALHALTHQRLEIMPAAQATYQVLKDREILEAQFGRIVRGMAYPYGTFTDETVQILKNCGVAYCRTVRSTEKFDIPTDWLRLDPTCHHVSPKLPELTKKFLDKKVSSNDKSQLFYLWGHAYEFARDNNWDVIEEFCKAVSGKEDIWHATNMEIYEYVQNFNRLVFSLDQRTVQNPTAQTVWFQMGKTLYSVEPGQIKVLE